MKKRYRARGKGVANFSLYDELKKAEEVKAMAQATGRSVEDVALIGFVLKGGERLMERRALEELNPSENMQVDPMEFDNTFGLAVHMKDDTDWSALDYEDDEESDDGDC